MLSKRKYWFLVNSDGFSPPEDGAQPSVEEVFRYQTSLDSPIIVPMFIKEDLLHKWAKTLPENQIPVYGDCVDASGEAVKILIGMKGLGVTHVAIDPDNNSSNLVPVGRAIRDLQVD